MKCYKRFLFVFLCLPVLFVAFSITANAEAVSANPKVNIVNFESYQGGTMGQTNIVNNTSNESTYTRTFSNATVTALNFVERLIFADYDGGILLPAGKTYSFSASNLYFEMNLPLSNGSTFLFTMLDGIQDAYAIYTDNTRAPLTVNYSYNSYNATYSVDFEKFTPSKDVQKIYVEVNRYFTKNTVQDIGLKTGATSWELNFGTGTTGDNNPLLIDIEIQSEEVGLLSGILGWVQNIFNSVENIFNSIVELPSKIWTFIEDGLKNLFVPDEGYMSDYKDRWDELLKERLGAVYEVCSIVTDSWDGIINADQTNTIALPLVSLPFGDTTFSFGGQDVEIVPAGFEVLVDALKLIIGIVCTYLFVNGLLKRYDEVMGVEK